MKATIAAVKKILSLQCDEASQLMSDAMDRDLSFVERVALRGHFLACKTCPPAVRQMRFIRRATRSLDGPNGPIDEDREEQTSAVELSDAARKRIQSALRAAEQES